MVGVLSNKAIVLDKDPLILWEQWPLLTDNSTIYLNLPAGWAMQEPNDRRSLISPIYAFYKR
jgi:hypothetical protein